MNRTEQIKQLEKEWNENPRWADVERPYTAEEVVNLRSSVNVEYTLAKLGSEKFWNHLQGDEPICALGAVTGNQAVQEVQAGLKAICSVFVYVLRLTTSVSWRTVWARRCSAS